MSNNPVKENIGLHDNHLQFIETFVKRLLTFTSANMKGLTCIDLVINSKIAVELVMTNETQKKLDRRHSNTESEGTTLVSGKKKRKKKEEEEEREKDPIFPPKIIINVLSCFCLIGYSFSLIRSS